MSGKKISRKALEKMFDLTRAYYSSDALDQKCDEMLAERFEVARVIEEGGGPNWFAIENFASSFFGLNGLQPDIDNESLILMLKRMGWRVTEMEA